MVRFKLIPLKMKDILIFVKISHKVSINIKKPLYLITLKYILSEVMLITYK